jgi:hypothetical protein
VNVAVSILYMVVFSHLVDPGHEEQHYRDHIQVAAPYCSIVAGMPLMFLAGWWVGGWWKGAFAVKAGLVGLAGLRPHRYRRAGDGGADSEDRRSVRRFAPDQAGGGLLGRVGCRSSDTNTIRVNSNG